MSLLLTWHLPPGTIDRAALTQKLAASNVVGDSNAQMASRHLQVAERLLDKGRLEEARSELSEGLKREPGSVPLKMAMAKVLLQQGDAKGAMALIDGLKPATVAPWQLNLPARKRRPWPRDRWIRPSRTCKRHRN